MKKLLLLLSVIAIFASPSFANCNYMGRCTKYSPNSLAKTSQLFSNTIGMTTLGENFANNVIKSELEKSTKQKFDVSLKAFTLASLLDGKFRSLTISGKNIEIEGIHFSSVKIQTLCDFNHIDIMSKPLKLKENMVLGFWTEISDEDLRKILQTKAYADKLNKLDLTKFGIVSYNVEPSTISISDDAFNATIKANFSKVLKVTPADILLAVSLNVKDEKLVSSKLSLMNLYGPVDLSKYTGISNIEKYLQFPINLFGNEQAEVQVQDLSFSGNKVLVHGMIFLPKTS